MSVAPSQSLNDPSPMSVGDGASSGNPPEGMQSGGAPAQPAGGSLPGCWDKASSDLHPACRLREMQEGHDAQRSPFCLLFEPYTRWVLEEVVCEKCGVLKPVTAFTKKSASRALRRVSRACIADPVPRGQGGIVCNKCVMGSLPPKNVVLEAIRAGKIRGKVKITLELEVPGNDVWEDTLEELWSETGTLDLSSGLPMKPIEAKLYAAGADWIQHHLRGPWDDSCPPSDAEWEEAEVRRCPYTGPAVAEPTGRP